MSDSHPNNCGSGCDDGEDPKQIMKFVPLELVRQAQVSFDVLDLGLSIDANTWPSNLIYNPELLQSNDMFIYVLCVYGARYKRSTSINSTFNIKI